MAKLPWEQPGNAAAQRRRFEDLTRDLVRRANQDYGVDGLCRATPDRLEGLVKKKGGRLKH